MQLEGETGINEAEGDRTPDLCIANKTLLRSNSKNLALHDVHEIPGILVEIQFQLVLLVHL